MTSLTLLLVVLGAGPHPAASKLSGSQANEAAAPPTAMVTTVASLAPMIDAVKAAVVNVDVRVRRATPAQNEGGLSDDQLERYFGLHGVAKNQLQQGAGSGFIVDSKGLVITNNHVVEGAVLIRVRLEDGRAFDGDVLGRDPLTDVAVIRLRGSPEGLSVVKLGDSSAMKVGDFAVAIGNPFGLASSVSLGIISALNRNINAGPYDQFLQTDAAINPGNSGGPLFNLKGEVIGINTAIVNNATGLGFAVPSNVAKKVLPQIQQYGYVTRGWLGVGIQDLNPTLAKALNVPVADGAVILTVGDNTPAKKGGLAEDDVVVEAAGIKVVTGNGLSRAVATEPPDSEVKLVVYRKGKPLDLTIKLGTRPDEDAAARANAPSDTAANRQLKIGLGFQDIDPRLASAVELPTSGALVIDVLPASPAERAGLRRGMVIVEAGGKTIRGRDDLTRVLAEGKSGVVLLLRVMLPGHGKALHGLEFP